MSQMTTTRIIMFTAAISDFSIFIYEKEGW